MTTREAAERHDESAVARYGREAAKRLRSVAAATMAAASIAGDDDADNSCADLAAHGRQTVEVELAVIHQGSAGFHHLVLEVMVPHVANNGRVWTMWEEIARIDVNRLANERPETAYPGIFRLSAMVHPDVIPDESGSTKPQAGDPEQA